MGPHSFLAFLKQGPFREVANRRGISQVVQLPRLMKKKFFANVVRPGVVTA
jgi:hypothetical protein